MMGIVEDLEKAREKVREIERPFLKSLLGLDVVMDVHLPPNAVVVHIGTDLWERLKREKELAG